MDISQIQEIKTNIQKVMIGNEKTIDLVLAALLSGGHILLEDVPGTGKTIMAKSLAKSIRADFGRVQFTPDLLPSDVTGMNIFNRKTGEFELHKGPVFTNILLADEINRATPRTQAGLLESMEERQVTIDGVTFKLENPFFVIATQNPVETAGTFPLPEAQLDRFMMRLSVGLPSEAEEIAILDRFMKKDPGEELEAVVSLDELAQMRDAVREVYVHPEIEKYMVEIVAMTRKKDKVIMGVSPRGTLALLRAVKAYAALSGRSYCIPDDVKTLAVPVLSHRLKVNYGYQTEGDSRKVIEEILESVQTPTENFEG